MIKLKNILREAGLLKEQAVKPEYPFSFQFESGKLSLDSEGQKTLNDIINQVTSLLNRDYKIESIDVYGRESAVPNQPPYQEEGSLAKARATELAKQIKQKFPNIDIKTSYNPKAEGPAWDGKNDDRYKPYQLVTATIKLNKESILSPRYTYDLLVRPATATEVNFYQANKKPSPGALHFNYSNLRTFDTAGTLVGKSSGTVINEKRFREFINKVASGTNFEMRDTAGNLISNEEYVKRMAPSGIIGKFKTLSDVIRPIPDLQIFLLENADAIRAKFPNVDIDRGEYVKGVDNIIKLFKK